MGGNGTYVHKKIYVKQIFIFQCVYQTLFERGVISKRVPSRKQIYMYIWNTICIFFDNVWTVIWENYPCKSSFGFVFYFLE